MPDGVVAEAGGGRLGKDRGERRPCTRQVVGGESGPGPVQGGTDLGGEPGVLGVGGEDDQGEDVVVEGERGVVADGDPGAPVERPADVVEEEAVVGHVGVEVDPASAEVEAADRPITTAGVRKVTLDEDRADRVEDLPRWRVHQALAADAEKHHGVLHAVRDRPGDVQPGAVELASPRRPRLDGTEPRPVEVGEGERLG